MKKSGSVGVLASVIGGLWSIAAQANSATSTNAEQAISACRAEFAESICEGEWNSVRFRLDQNGGGSMTTILPDGKSLRWGFSCRLDKVESVKTCSLQGGEKGLITFARFYVIGAPPLNSVSWGGYKFPGSHKVAKIGTNAPMRWDADESVSGASAVRIIEAAKKGGLGIFRWYDWPNHTVHDEEMNFANFADVWSLFKAATSD